MFSNSEDEAASEVAKFKWFLLGLLAFVVSGCYSVHELRYQVWGATAEGQVTDVRQTTSIGRRGRRIHKLQVDFQFADRDGTSHRGSTTVGQSANFGPGQPVRIEYLPGVDLSGRIEGYNSKYMLLIFGGAILVIGFGLWQIAKLANDTPIENEPTVVRKKKRKLRTLKQDYEL